MEKNEMEITISVSKTIQEKQFEPFVLSLSAKMVTTDEDADQDFKDGINFLSSVMEEEFAERGLRWGKRG